MWDAVELRQEPMAVRQDVARQEGKSRLVVRREKPSAEVEEEQRDASRQQEGQAADVGRPKIDARAQRPS